MSEKNLSLDFIYQVLNRTIDDLNHVDVGEGENKGDVAQLESASEAEEKAFDSPTQIDTDEIQDLSAVTESFRAERLKFELKRLHEQIETLKTENSDKKAVARGKRIDNRLRLQMANLTFKFMQYWCVFVALIVFIYIAKKDGDPDPSVIIALLGTSTVSIVGLVGFVVSGLFKSSKEDKS